MQTFLHYRWRVPSTLHRLHLRRIIPLLLLALCVTGAKAQSYQTFDADKCYTKVLIDAKINDFAGNTKPMGFGSYNAETGKITQPQWKTAIKDGSNRSLVMDYVAGLVAKACIEAADYYKDFTWSKPWFKLVENYATKVSVPTTGASLDDLNASKMYFALADLTNKGAKYENSATYDEAIKQLKNAVTGLKAVNTYFSIRNSSSVYYGYDSNGNLQSAVVKDNTDNTKKLTPASTGMNAIGGWYHKATYPNQMWCDSEYMGPALLAQLVAYATKNSSAGIGTVTGTTEGDWKLIAKQFDITWNYLWNSKDKLLYHGFSATPTAVAAHTHTWATGTYGNNTAYWGRAIGWYFLALVDVLENMPDGIEDNTYISTQTNLSSRDANIKTRLKSYLTDLAAGIWKQMKSDTKLWTNVINEAVGAEHKSYSTTDAVIQSNTQNYLEASASAIYIAAYIKAMRLGLLPSDTYKSDIETAYKNYISNFITTDNKIINTCASAGLGGGSVNIDSEQNDYKSGGSRYRNGTADYYTRGYDVTMVTGYQEGKPLGAFILASTEYERYMKADYAPSFTATNAEKPTAQTVTKGQSVTLHAAAMAKPLATYKWYSYPASSTRATTPEGTLIEGATSSDLTVKPEVNTYYYCVATNTVNNATATATTDHVLVTVSEASNEAVLNPSNLAYTQSYTNNNAWTPKANGTIEVSELVTSTSTGAYSITSGNDVATISGTTITALKDGAFTLSQAADDNYKEGSIEITVRIGDNVTNDGSNAYSFTAETKVSDGMTIARKDITMTFGNDGFWSKPSTNSYTGGQVNPQNITDNIPTAGTFYKFAPTKSGSLAVKVKLGHDGNGKLRPLYVSENGTLVKAKKGDGTELDPTNMPEATASYEGFITFPVKANTDYYVYVPGSKLGFYNFTFSPYPTYTVTFNSGSNGTCTTTSISQSSQGESIPLPDVTPADGYTFDGWYTDEALTSKVEGTTYTPTADITLYAKWTPITDLFTLTGVTSTTVSVNSQTTVAVTGNYATITGGSAQLYNGHSSAKDMILNSQINLNGSSSSYLKITLENSLKVGDEIIINPATSSFKLSAEESNSSDKTKTVTGSYVIQNGDAVVGKNVIYLYKGSNSLITDINITRYYPESDSRATFTYNGAEIAFSEETAGDKSAYTTTLEIGASKKEQTITITPKTKVAGAAITQDKTTVSGDITITVPSTIGNTTTSTYTVTSTDKTSTTTYEINVKLVKENVVLVYAQSDGQTEWIWDKNKDSTQPTFEQPTLKVYLAKADGTKSETEVTNVTGIIYKSDVEDVAIFDEKAEEEKIKIKANANGGAKIYAILENNPYYNDAQTFFNILVKQGYSYSVADDETIKNGPSLNQSVYIKKVETKGETNVETNLVKMTFGGWKWSTYKDIDDHNKLKSTYEVNGSTRKDGWKMLESGKESEIASIDGYKSFISGYSDAVDESKEASKKEIYGSTRYGWFKPAETRDDGYLETYPYTLPVRGAYMTFEPTQNGTLTVYILQNGAWNTFDQDTQIGDVLYKNGDIKPGEFRPHSFYICNQRGLNVDQFSPNTFTCTTKQKVQGKYYCDRTTSDKQNDPYNIATWTEFKGYMSQGEQERVAANWSSGINGAQKIVQLDNGSYLAIQKGIVKYSFFVTANETYYLFSNFSKLGFCGANFVPSETVIPADDAAHKISLSDETAYPKTEKVIIDDTDPDKIKYAWKFDNERKGYVKGFTIPLFKSITLNRTFKKGQWTTLTLPFNLTQTEVEQIFGKGTQILVFQDAQTEGTKLHIKFFYHEIQNILPGYPYLIKPTLEGYDGTPSTANAPIYTIDSSSGNLTSFTVYDKAINPNIEQHEFTAIKDQNYVAKGTPDYCTQALTGVEGNFCKQYEEGDLFISEGNGKLYISKGSSYGKGYRSYIDGPASSATKTLSLSFSGVEDGEDDGTTTEISVAELADDVIEAFGIKGVYNLNGQKVAETTRNLPAGIYVVNGRKVVVK